MLCKCLVGMNFSENFPDVCLVTLISFDFEHVINVANITYTFIIALKLFKV